MLHLISRASLAWLKYIQRTEAVMSNTIIVPVDLAHEDKAAAMLETAGRIGGKDARVVLVNVVVDVPSYVAVELPGGFVDRAKEDARAELAKIAGSAGIDAEIVVRSGQAASAILAVAKEKGADVIIVASHRPEFADYFLGSTAARVVRHAPCSVYVLR
jgi:nucleotide-binding universal stress UspA family protein